MIGDLRRDSFKKCLHFCCNLIYTVHDPGIYYISGNDLFPRKPGDAVDPYDFTCIFALIVQSSHSDLETLSGTGTDLQIITLADLCTNGFIHLSSSDRNLSGNNDISICQDRKLGALRTNVYHHAALILLHPHAHGKCIRNWSLHHINTVLMKPVTIRHIIICALLDRGHIQRN